MTMTEIRTYTLFEVSVYKSCIQFGKMCKKRNEDGRRKVDAATVSGGMRLI